MSESNHVDDAMDALIHAQEVIEDVGSLKQDEFRFYHHLTTALVHALLAIAKTQPDALK